MSAANHRWSGNLREAGDDSVQRGLVDQDFREARSSMPQLSGAGADAGATMSGLLRPRTRSEYSMRTIAPTVEPRHEGDPGGGQDETGPPGADSPGTTSAGAEKFSPPIATLSSTDPACMCS